MFIFLYRLICAKLGRRIWRRRIPFVIVYTKCDKQSEHKTLQNAGKLKKALLGYFEEVPQEFFTSAEKGGGRDEILGFIGDINSRFVVPAQPAAQE